MDFLLLCLVYEIVKLYPYPFARILTQSKLYKVIVKLSASGNCLS